MRTLLANIELDVQELKYLIDVVSREQDTPLREVAKRSVLQMRFRLDELLQELDKNIEKEGDFLPHLEKLSPKTVASMANESILTQKTLSKETLQVVDKETSMEPNVARILAEHIKPQGDLEQMMSLNDSFRFSHELFHDDTEYMKKVLRDIEKMNNFSEVSTYLSSELGENIDLDASNDFAEFLKKNFE